MWFFESGHLFWNGGSSSGSLLTLLLNESREFIGNLDHSTSYSPKKALQLDKNSKSHKCKEILAHGDTENSRVGFTGLLISGKPITGFFFLF